jgi:dTDP-4-dehydrorhamnose reductase
LRVANDLENHMDLALTYRTGRPFKERIESDGSAIVQVAKGLGMTTLADELSMVFRESLEETLPATVRWDRSRGYELPVRTTSRASSVTRFASRARRALGRRLRRRLGTLAVWRRRSTRQREGTRIVPGEAITRAQSRPRILVTGAAGQVGRGIVPYLREHFSLRLFDIERVKGEGDDEVVRADVRDGDALRQACRGVLAIVHLAVVGDQERDFTARMMPVNVDGTYQIFEAARCTGVGRVVLASTGQVVGAYPAAEWLTANVPVRPSSVYACTKVFGEALARYYAECHGVAAICLRIGWFDAYDGDLLRHRPEMQRTWSSPRDVAQLVVKSIQSDARFAVLFAVSDNPRRRWDLDEARTTVGYVPEDRAPDRLGGDAT